MCVCACVVICPSDARTRRTERGAGGVPEAAKNDAESDPARTPGLTPVVTPAGGGGDGVLPSSSDDDEEEEEMADDSAPAPAAGVRALTSERPAVGGKMPPASLAPPTVVGVMDSEKESCFVFVFI